MNLEALQGASQSRSNPSHCFSPPGTLAAEAFPCEVDPPTLDEVCTVIRQLHNNRAPGEDGIPAEVYKTCLESLGPWLHRVITNVWICEAVQITGVRPFFSLYSRKKTSEYAQSIEALA